jgi:hypothetical protein
VTNQLTKSLRLLLKLFCDFHLWQFWIIGKRYLILHFPASFAEAYVTYFVTPQLNLLNLFSGNASFCLLICCCCSCQTTSGSACRRSTALRPPLPAYSETPRQALQRQNTEFRNKYSQKRNIGVSVPISTFMRR